MSNYVPQLDAYSPDNLYTSNYYQAGGSTYDPMPNCTRYAYGRWWALLGAEPTFMRNLWNGEDWWTRAPSNVQRGSTPKLGAIACFKDGPYSGLGHVAVVERIYSDGHVIFSNSAWHGSMFYKRCGTPQNNYHDGGYGLYGFETAYIFQGFLYCPEDFDPEIDPQPPGPDPDPGGYGANPLVRWVAKKQIYRNQGRLGTDVYT